MKHLKIFKDSIEKELENQIKGINSTPILDRLQIHFNSLEEDTQINDLLTEQNMGSNNFLSMLYQIVSPAKKKIQLSITLDGILIKGKSGRDKIQNLVKKVGVENVKKLKTYSRFVYKNDMGDVIGNAYKIINDTYSFDTSFGGVGATASIEYFIKELVTELNLKVEFKNEETFSYN